MSDKSAAVLPITPRSRLASQNASSPALHVDPSQLGQHLMRGREQTKRSLEEIADTTKISIHQLRALERGDLHVLPAGIYRRAIVRQYAAAVGLNVEETIRDLAGVSTEVDADIQRLEAVAHPRSRTGSSPFTTALWSSVAALVVLGAVAAATTAWYRAGKAAPATPVSVTTANAPTPEAPTIAPVAATEAVRASAADIELATEPAVAPTPTQTETGSVADEATEGELRITSEPEGALVTVNGVGWGATPVTIRYMPFGKKLIRATKPRYVSAQRGFDFLPDRRARSVLIRLSPESSEAR